MGCVVPKQDPNSVRFSIDKGMSYEGEQSVKYTSGDNTGRFEIFTTIDDMNLKGDYVYSIKVTAEDVKVTGLYIRIQTYRPASEDGKTLTITASSAKITGTMDGEQVDIKGLKAGSRRFICSR